MSLAEGEVHVWSVDLTRPVGTGAEADACLSADERERARRFMLAEDGRRYTAAHAALRGILGAYLARPPAQLKLAARERGKLVLADPAEAWLRFNLSHSHERALVACARGRDVGADIEWMRSTLEPAAIVERFFSPAEQREWASLAPSLRRAAFFHGWTRKEAYVKALGEGFSHPSDGYSVSLNPEAPAALLDDPFRPGAAAAWALRTVSSPPGYVAAVAVAGPFGTLVERSWPPA